MDFDNVVLVKTRTGKNEEFTYDGLPNVIDAKKGKRLPREIAELAIGQNALRWDSGTGLVIDSLLYIVDDESSELPKTPLTTEEIEDVKATDGLGEDTILVNGAIVKKTRLNLKPKKENFAANNM